MITVIRLIYTNKGHIHIRKANGERFWKSNTLSHFNYIHVSTPCVWERKICSSAVGIFFFKITKRIHFFIYSDLLIMLIHKKKKKKKKRQELGRIEEYVFTVSIWSVSISMTDYDSMRHNIKDLKTIRNWEHLFHSTNCRQYRIFFESNGIRQKNAHKTEGWSILTFSTQSLTRTIRWHEIYFLSFFGFGQRLSWFLFDGISANSPRIEQKKTKARFGFIFKQLGWYNICISGDRRQLRWIE